MSEENSLVCIIVFAKQMWLDLALTDKATGCTQPSMRTGLVHSVKKKNKIFNINKNQINNLSQHVVTPLSFTLFQT